MALMFLTPGFRLLLLRAHKLLAVVLLALVIGRTFALVGYGLPAWALAGLPVILIFLSRFSISVYKNYRWRREAAAIDARIPPVAKGKWPGNIDIFVKQLKLLRIGYPGDGLDELLETYGPIVNITVLGDTLLLTTQPEHIQIMLASDAANYEKGPRFRESMGSVLGTGVFNSDGDMWKFHRSMTRPFFTRDRITDFDIFDRHAEEAIAQMRMRLRGGYSVDFLDLISRFTLDSASEFLFGRSVNTLKAGLPYAHNISSVPVECLSKESAQANEFSRAFLLAQDRMFRRQRFGPAWPLFEMFGDLSKAHMKVIRAFIDPVIRDAVGRQQETPSRGEWEKGGDRIDKDETLIDHLVKLTSDPEIIRDEIFNIMIAGRDTTASTLTFIVYFLAKYPHVCKRLREEIISKVGPTRRPSLEDIREMKYLRAVINETLRLFPVVPFNIRENIQPACWPSPDPSQPPIYIPARTKLAYSVFLMHRRADLWGPDVLEFDPDRFLDERLKTYLAPRPFIFLPFNAGPRICLGQQFAYNEMSFMLVRLLQSFTSFALDAESLAPEFRVPKEWKTSGTGRMKVDDIVPKMSVTLYAAGGLWIKAQEANATA